MLEQMHNTVREGGDPVPPEDLNSKLILGALKNSKCSYPTFCNIDEDPNKENRRTLEGDIAELVEIDSEFTDANIDTFLNKIAQICSDYRINTDYYKLKTNPEILDEVDSNLHGSYNVAKRRLVLNALYNLLTRYTNAGNSSKGFAEEVKTEVAAFLPSGV